MIYIIKGGRLLWLKKKNSELRGHALLGHAGVKPAKDIRSQRNNQFLSATGCLAPTWKSPNTNMLSIGKGHGQDFQKQICPKYRKLLQLYYAPHHYQSWYLDLNSPSWELVADRICHFDLSASSDSRIHPTGEKHNGRLCG